MGCLAPKATSTISTPAPKAQRTTWKGAERLYDPEGQVICCEIVSRNAWRASLMLHRLYDYLNKAWTWHSLAPGSYFPPEKSFGERHGFMCGGQMGLKILDLSACQGHPFGHGSKITFLCGHDPGLRSMDLVFSETGSVSRRKDGVKWNWACASIILISIIKSPSTSFRKDKKM